MLKIQDKIKKSILGSMKKNQPLGNENSENKVNSIEVIHPDNTSRLTISDRNSRLMSIITITGIILVILSYLFRSMKNIFSSLTFP